MPSARRFSTILGVALAALARRVGAWAQIASGNTYTIGGIDVDVTGPDAIQARQQAVREARQRAVKLLVERMVPAEDRARVPPINDARLDGMVRGVEFTRERAATSRFIGTLSVVFSADPVKAWLGEAGIAVAETVARAALVIPLWKGRDGLQPLDERNAWRDAWSGLDTLATAVPVAVIRGDQLDQNALSVEEAFVGDVYGAGAAERALSRADGHRGDGRGRQVGTAQGRRHALRHADRRAKSELPVSRSQDAGQLAAAARKIHAKLDEEWRSLATVRRDAQAVLDVAVPIRALGDW